MMDINCFTLHPYSLCLQPELKNVERKAYLAAHIKPKQGTPTHFKHALEYRMFFSQPPPSMRTLLGSQMMQLDGIYDAVFTKIQ